MPYSYPDNVPDTVKNLPEGAQRIFVDVFNSTYAEGQDEDAARQAAWGAVKNAYEQDAEGEWTQKASDAAVADEAGGRLLRYVGHVALSDDSNRSRAQVFRTGTFYHPRYGKFTITDDDLKAMAENFGTVHPVAPTQMVVDYEHQSMFEGRKAEAAGWVSGVEREPGKLFTVVDWNDEAADQIRAKKYRFISPVWKMDGTDKETGKPVGPLLLTMALTNRPFIEGMEPVVLSERMEAANANVMTLSETTLAAYQVKLAADEPQGTTPEPESGNTANVEPHEAADAGVDGDGGDNTEGEEANMDEAKLRELLGIGPDDDIEEAIAALKAKVSDAEAAKDTAEADTATAQAAKDTAEAALLARDVDADVTAAVEAGQLLPRQAEWAKALRAKDPDTFKAYLATAAAPAPELGERGAIDRADADDTLALTDEEKKTGAILGVDPEDTLAQKKADAKKVPVV
jgi:phage I-like protein